jgi:Putative peptidoglycan binding domain
MYDPMIRTAERPCRPFPAARWMALLLAVVAMGCPVAFGGDQPVFRKTLRGLPGVGVRVERIPLEAEQAGLARRQVQTEVEQRLREHGIRVLTPPEVLSAFGRPALAVTIQITSAEHRPQELSGVHITVAVKQQVLLERHTAMPAVEAAIWEVAALGVVGQDAWPRVREDVATLVDRFIQAYRSVNPAPAARTESPQPSQPPSRGALIRQAQERLAEKGFDPGPITGQRSAKTQDALRRFQRAQGLSPTGALDEHTRQALGMD